MKNQPNELIHVLLDNGDSVLFLNANVILSKECWERGERSPEDVGEQLARALNVPLAKHAMPVPKDEEWQWLDVYELLPPADKVEVKPFETRQITRFQLLNQGHNAAGYTAEATRTGDEGIYEEARITLFHEQDCVADVLAGLSEAGEPRFLITCGGMGDGDHNIAVYPLRELRHAVDTKFN